MGKRIIINTKVKLRKGGRKIAKLTEKLFTDKAKKFIMDICKDDSWLMEHVTKTESSSKILNYLPSAIRKIYHNDKKGDTTIKKDFKGITPDWENYDMVGSLRTVKGAPYITMHIGGDWECPICVMVYHDGKEFRCYVPEKGNPYRKDTKSLLGNIDAQYDYDNETYTYEWIYKGKKCISDDKYVFDELVKDGIFDKEKDKEKIKGIANHVNYDIDMCIEDFSSRVEVKPLKESYENTIYNNIINKVAKTVKKTINEFYEERELPYSRYFLHNHMMLSHMLNEKHGMLSYDISAKTNISNISKQIDKCIKTNNFTGIDNIVTVNNNIKCYKFIVELNLSWIKYLNIFINKEYLNNSCDCVLLFDNIVINDDNTQYLATKTNSSNNYIYRSILIQYNNDYKKIEPIIYHELKHIYDETHKNVSDLNNDLVNEYKLKLSTPQQYLEYQEHLFLINNIDYKKKYIKDNITSDMISAIVSDAVYYMNISEIQARLENTRDVIDNLSGKTYNKYNDELLLSDDYKLYLNYYILYKLIIKYTFSAIKEYFVTTDTFKTLINDVYGNIKYFLNFNKYNDIELFDMFFKYFVDLIYNKYLRHCANYIINKNNNENING